MGTHEAPVARHRSADEKVRLLCVANDRPIKGLAVLLDAVEMHLQSANWQLDIVGQCGDAIRNRIQASAKLSAHVTAHGFRSDVPDFSGLHTSISNQRCSQARALVIRWLKPCLLACP